MNKLQDLCDLRDLCDAEVQARFGGGGLGDNTYVIVVRKGGRARQIVNESFETRAGAYRYLAIALQDAVRSILQGTWF